MIEERKLQRRSNVDRRINTSRRIREEEWLPPYGSRKFSTSDRRCGERRGLDRRRPV